MTDSGPITIIDGTITGFTWLAVGAGAGAAAFVALPAAGIALGSKKGVLSAVAGGVGGLGGGTIVFGGCILVGGVTCLSNVVSGTISTPFTVVALVTDDDLYRKTPCNLDEEKAAPGPGGAGSSQKGAEASPGAGGSYVPGTVKETALYETLGVASDATSEQIKKAYYRTALKEHPDRNQGKNTERFQAVSSAYQVLSDVEQRRKYDKEGAAGLQATPMMDAAEVFAKMFGEGQFDHLVVIPGATAIEGDQDVTLDREQIARLAKTLAARLEPFVTGDVKVFTADARVEVEKLSATNFGPEVLARRSSNPPEQNGGGGALTLSPHHKSSGLLGTPVARDHVRRNR